MKLYLLDNFDSFTYNLVDQFRSLGCEVVIYRNDVAADYIAEKLLSEQEPAALVLSPGPGAPHEAGSMMALIAKVAGKVPMLGICLGHQAMVEYYGGTVARAPRWWIDHNLEFAYRLIRQPRRITRNFKFIRYAWWLLWHKF